MTVRTMRPDRDSAEYRHAAWMASLTAGRFYDTPSPREKVLGGPRPGLRPRHAGHLELFPGVSGYRRSVRRSITTSRLPAGEGSSRGPRKLIRRLRPRLVSAVRSCRLTFGQARDPRPAGEAGEVKNESYI